MPRSVGSPDTLLVGFIEEISSLPQGGDMIKALRIQRLALAKLSLLPDSPQKAQAEELIEKYCLNSLTPSKDLVPTVEIDSSKYGRIEIERIKGDGHCCFRSMAHGLIDYYHADTSFKDSIASKSSTSFFFGDNDFAKMQRFFKTGRLGARAKSDEIVMLLRKIACDYNETHRSYIVEGDSSQYFKDMRTKNAWGGPSEISAVSEVLGVEMSVISDQGKLYENNSTTSPIVLFHRGNHFDLVKRVLGFQDVVPLTHQGYRVYQYLLAAVSSVFNRLLSILDLRPQSHRA